MHFEIVGDITDIEPSPVGAKIRISRILRKRYGAGRWWKLKGVAMVRLFEGTVCRAEFRWFEAHGSGKKWLRSIR